MPYHEVGADRQAAQDSGVRRRSRLLGIVFAGFGLTLFAAAAGYTSVEAQAQTIRLRFAHSGTEVDPIHLAVLEMGKKVKERTKGAIEIRPYPNSTLGNDGTALQGVRAGTIDMSVTGNPYYTGMVPKLNALDLPYQFDSAEQAYKVFDGPVGRSLLDELGAFQFKGLAFWELGFRNLANSKRPVRNADDIKGLKIRTTPNPAHILMFQLLGASPQPMAYAEVFPALESRAIDGHENAINSMYASKMYEVQKYLSMTRHCYTAMPVVMNKAKFDSLSAEHQKILLEEAIAAAQWQRAYNAQHYAETVKGMRDKGMEVEENPDIESIKAIVKAETRKTFIEKNGEDVLKAIEAVK
jgi:tripartite ATP-independent transporter DctP family solute receptor